MGVFLQHIPHGGTTLVSGRTGIGCLKKRLVLLREIFTPYLISRFILSNTNLGCISKASFVLSIHDIRSQEP